MGTFYSWEPGPGHRWWSPSEQYVVSLVGEVYVLSDVIERRVVASGSADMMDEIVGLFELK